jgi:hypothetical protein
MNTPPFNQRIKTRSPKSALLWPLGLAGVLLLLGLGAALLPPPVKNEAGNNFRRPAGQLKADARTVVAALRYLFEPDSDLAICLAGTNCSPIAPTPSTSMAFGCFSNQTEIRTEASTNRPARS